MMKSLVITFLVCLVSVYAQAPVADDRCPSGIPTTPIHLPNPTDCSRFFTCSNGFAFPVQCQPGFYFSVAASACRLAHEVDCTASPGPDPIVPDTTTTAAPVETTTTLAPPPGETTTTTLAPDTTTTVAGGPPTVPIIPPTVPTAAPPVPPPAVP